MIEWKPIETAPKEPVLLFFPRTGKDRIRGNPPMMKVGRVEEYPARKPTHWMPLPPQPENTEFSQVR